MWTQGNEFLGKIHRKPEGIEVLAEKRRIFIKINKSFWNNKGIKSYWNDLVIPASIKVQMNDI